MTVSNPHLRASAPTQDWRPDEFKTSSASEAAQGSCVEVAHREDFVAVRNSNHRWGEGPLIEYDRAEWVAFLRGAKAGEFDFDFFA